MSDLNPYPKLDLRVAIALPSIIGIRKRLMVDIEIMTEPSLKVSHLSLHITSTGYVALRSDKLNTEADYALFGSDGLLPPQNILSLTQRLLNNINAAPDISDAADLRLFAKNLKASLLAVETTLAKLEKDSR